MHKSQQMYWDCRLLKRLPIHVSYKGAATLPSKVPITTYTKKEATCLDSCHSLNAIDYFITFSISPLFRKIFDFSKLLHSKAFCFDMTFWRKKYMRWYWECFQNMGFYGGKEGSYMLFVKCNNFGNIISSVFGLTLFCFRKYVIVRFMKVGCLRDNILQALCCWVFFANF